MKTNLLFLMIFLFPSFPSNLYSQRTQDKLYGTWIFDYETSFKNMEYEARTNYEIMNENTQRIIKATYEGRQLIFKKDDNSFIQISGDGSQFSGRWEYDDQEYALNLIYSDGMIYPLVVIKNTGSSLTLKPKVIDKGKPLFQEWHFIKN